MMKFDPVTPDLGAARRKPVQKDQADDGRQLDQMGGEKAVHPALEISREGERNRNDVDQAELGEIQVSQKHPITCLCIFRKVISAR
jgi:hypothetical protein